MACVASKTTVGLCSIVLIAAGAGCAATGPAPTRIVRMGATDNSAYAGRPAAGSVWRLHEQELLALGPIVEPPAPPPVTAKRAPAVPAVIPAYGYFGFGVGIGIGSGWRHPFYWPGHGWRPHSRQRAHRPRR